jgi:hypothetical protein
LLSCCLMLATRMDRAWCVDRINRALETLYRHTYMHAVIPWRGVADVCRQCVRMREKDWCCRARVTLARSPWRARVACVPRMRLRQLFSRTLLSQRLPVPMVQNNGSRKHTLNAWQRGLRSARYLAKMALHASALSRRNGAACVSAVRL